MARPLIGVCAAVEPADWAAWKAEPATLLPLSYTRAVQAAGGIAVLLAPDPRLTASPDEILDHLDGLILAGGNDIDASTHGADPHPETKGTNPERDAFELALARRALERDMPLLGICRGMQMLNIAVGGTLDQHLPDKLGHEGHRSVPGIFGDHEVKLEPGSLAAEVAGAEQIAVKSHHHQGVAEVGEGLTLTGWSVEDDAIEAIELSDRAFALGVLWHPEEDPEDRVIPSFVKRVG